MRVASLALLALEVAACASPVGQVIDGWEIGEPRQCADVPAGDGPVVSCAAELREVAATARRWRDDRDPGHAPIAMTRVYDEPLEHMVHSGGPIYRVVFDLFDGTVKAVGVKTFLGIHAIGYGAEDR